MHESLEQQKSRLLECTHAARIGLIAINNDIPATPEVTDAVETQILHDARTRVNPEEDAKECNRLLAVINEGLHCNLTKARKSLPLVPHSVLDTIVR